jgi:hypothetical protein
VLCILGYDDIDEAVEIANDTGYGLAGYVSAADLDAARAVARRIRAGSVAINHAFDLSAPFGGYKKSGNGREWSEFGFDEYLETKATMGYAPAVAAGPRAAATRLLAAPGPIGYRRQCKRPRRCRVDRVHGAASLAGRYRIDT